MSRADAILPVESNTRGNDYFIGDLHGCLDLLQEAIKHLGPYDRLFIPGDFINRGPQSYLVVKYLQQQEKAKKQKIYATCGNHEAIVLAYLTKRIQLSECFDIALTNFDQALEEKEKEKNDHIEMILQTQDRLHDDLDAAQYDLKQVEVDMRDKMAHHLAYLQHHQSAMSEESVLQSFRKIYSDLISLHTDLLQIIAKIHYALEDNAMKLEQSKRDYAEWHHLLKGYQKLKKLLMTLDKTKQYGREMLWIDQISPNEMLEVKHFLSQLPVIITSPEFSVVHADLPFRDAELRRRIENSQLVLSPAEVSHALWSRVGEMPIMPDTHRYTICGHTIGGGIRKSTRHINLDFGAYLTGCLALLNWQQKTILLIGNHQARFDNGMTVEWLRDDMQEQLKQIELGGKLDPWLINQSRSPSP